jgi:hypothetical protein
LCSQGVCGKFSLKQFGFWLLLVQFDFIIMIFATMINVACSVYGSTKNEFYGSTLWSLDDWFWRYFIDSFGHLHITFFLGARFSPADL